jgi:hypothetical protein
MSEKGEIMRRANKRIVMLIILMFGFQFIFTAFASAAALYPPDISYQPPEQSREELYQDIFISLLLPYIQNEVDIYYSKYLIRHPMVAPYTVYILSAERPKGYRTFLFRLKLRVDCYIGPHNSVGLDDITVTVGGSGDVKIEKFEHIKSYALPPNYEDIIKKGYKNPIP